MKSRRGREFNASLISFCVISLKVCRIFVSESWKACSNGSRWWLSSPSGMSELYLLASAYGCSPREMRKSSLAISLLSILIEDGIFLPDISLWENENEF